MDIFIYLIAYLCLIVFVIAVVKRFVGYLKNPIHVRWELYPVAHEKGERAEYGGSYLEDVDWWKKPREKSLFNEMKVMIPEILFLKAVWEHNRSLWYVTYPFHLGLYLLVGFLGLLVMSAIAAIAGYPVGQASSCACGSAIAALTELIGPLGYILCLLGAIGLVFKRLTDSNLKKYSSFGHFFNLFFFIIVMGLAIATWLFIDKDFVMVRGFVVNMLTLNFQMPKEPLFAALVIATFVLIAYIPLTHMSHFFMKYFLYHDIRWGDEANVDTPETDAKIGIVLNYPITWSAKHIKGDGSRNTWAEVATFNPAAKDAAKDNEKE